MSWLTGAVHAHAVTTVFLCGLIWFVQLVHYPLFRNVDRASYPAFQRDHERRTTWIVGPAMALEVATVVAITILGWERLPRAPLLANVALLALVWLSTIFLQVPRHRLLEVGFDDEAHRFLTRSNWIRTVAWTLRAGLAWSFVLVVARPEGS